jgi:hypothetical protein
MFCRDPLYVVSPRNSLIRLIRWPQPTELTIIDLATPGLDFLRENVVRLSSKVAAEVVQVGSPSALDALGRVVAFQTRPPADVMYCADSLREGLRDRADCGRF